MYACGCSQSIAKVSGCFTPAMTRSVPPRWLAGGATAVVHTVPSATAIAEALFSTSTRSRSAGESGSMRVSVPSLPPATHTPPAPAAIPADRSLR
jgi:hypothetical protein